MRELAQATAQTAENDVEQFKNRITAENLDRFADAHIALFEKATAIYKAQKVVPVTGCVLTSRNLLG